MDIERINKMYKNFGRWIKDQRLNNEIDPHVVCRAASISASYLSSIEHGKRLPTFETLLIILSTIKAPKDIGIATWVVMHNNTKAKHIRIPMPETTDGLLALNKYLQKNN
jgi:transcriptional regulator with XRE-family HTH domain